MYLAINISVSIICVKKREGDDNWFMLPPQERGALMKSHGELGKTYLDVLSEFTTGGCGLDDWEWGITIFSNDDIQFKKNRI